MLEVSGLAVDHDKLRALWDIGFRVREGARVGLLGANGVGKSTTLGAIVGLYLIAAGTATYKGRSLVGAATPRNVDEGIALAPEGRRLFAGMTMRENLEMGAYAPGARKQVAGFRGFSTCFPSSARNSPTAPGPCPAGSGRCSPSVAR